jgi:hypothetical protein
MPGLRTLGPLLAITILLVVPAEATTSYYVGNSNEAAFNTAVGGMTLLDPSLTFSSSDLVPGGLDNASGTGINFLGFDDFEYPTIPDNFTVNSGKLTATNGAQHVTIAFPATGIYAFAIHFTLAAVSGSASWCVELSPGSCDYTVVNASPANVQFFGIISSTPITAPLYTRASGFAPTIVFTNFEAYGPTSVPEPRTMLLVGIGLVILPLTRRKSRSPLQRAV